MSGTSKHDVDSARGPRFNLKHLLLFTAYVAVAVTIFRLVGPVPGVPMLLGATAIVCALLRRDGFIAVLGCLAIALTVLLLPALEVSNRQRRPDCFHDLKLISLALLNYEAKYGSLPPPYIADDNGRPMHSWRVLILPFMEQQSLYKRYRFDEPWDGPNNRLLHGEIVPAFHCQEDNRSPATHTSYVAIVGPGSVWDAAKTTTIAETADGASNTILLVERHDSGTHWMAPNDVELDTYLDELKTETATRHQGSASVAYGDGRASSIRFDIDPSEFRALVAPAGNESVPP